MDNPNFNKILADALAKQNKTTNADRYFRNATDEEIAAKLGRIQDDALIKYANRIMSASAFDKCIERWLDWLKQEVDT